MRVEPSVKQDSKNLSRQGEQQSIPDRSRRYYTVETAWYFNTREDDPQGPFKNLGEAKDGLKVYLRHCGIVNFNG